MKENGRIVKELVGFVKEQHGINRRLERFVKEQHAMNKEQHILNVQSEKRFRAFYHMISNLQRHG